MRAFQLQPAEVIVSALEVGGADRPSENRFQQRNVFVEDLILKGFGACRDQNALAMEQRRKQIGQRFPGPRSRFDDDVALAVQCLIDRFGHADLRRAELVVAQLLFQHSAGAEELVHGPLSVYFRTPVRNGGSEPGREFRYWFPSGCSSFTA